MHQIIVFAIPLFALLIAAEFAYGLYVGRNTYRLNDAISSLSQGLLSQVVAVCTQLFQIGLYAMIYPHIAVLNSASFWDAWYGWVLAVVLFDFCDYWLHRVGHESAVFWAAHVVHHQSQYFNFSTALRQESAYMFLGWMFYLPMALVGVPPELFGIAGLIVLVYQFWIHTEHIGKLGWFDRVFSSPSNHRVHHAVNDLYIDKNYGAIFVLWDRMFGTFQEETEPCVYGTRAPLNSWDPLWSVAEVYAALFRQAARTRRWLDKVRIFFKAPGWQPDDLAREAPYPRFDITAVRKYDPAIALSTSWLAAVGFAIVLALTCWFLWRADEMTLAADYAATACVAVGLWCIGALLAGRVGRWAGSAGVLIATVLGLLACG